MRRTFLLLLAVAVAPHGAMAQRTTLYDCIPFESVVEPCVEISTSDLVELTCSSVRRYENYRGNVAWLALRYMGPIKIEIEAREVPGTRFPLFVEVVPLAPGDDGRDACEQLGLVVMRAYGRTRCEEWESEIVDLGFHVPIGGSYSVRLRFFGDSDAEFQSAYFGCIRVTPVTTAVVARTWTTARQLYR